MTTGIVFDIRRYSIHDGPGIRTTVFLKGCPLRCTWCHNPEGQSFEPELILRPGRCILCGTCLETCSRGAVTRADNALVTNRARCQRCGECVAACHAEARQMVGVEMAVEQVLAEVERDRPFHEQSGGGVTFSGGEPLAQPRFLRDLLSACRERGMHTVVETCGCAAWPMLDAIRSRTDFILYDLKLLDDARHRTATGASNRNILENLVHLSELGHPIRVRILIVPGVNDDEVNLQRGGEFLASLPRVPPVELLPYHRMAAAKYAGLGMDPGMPDIPSPARARMQEISALLQACGLEVHCA